MLSAILVPPNIFTHVMYTFFSSVAEITAERFLRPSQRFDAVMRFTAPAEYKRLKDSIDLMHDFTDKVIGERRKMLEKSIADGSYRAISEY